MALGKHSIAGPAGQLEVVVEGEADSSRVFVMCHPHPKFEGTMHNKVVTTTCRAMQKLGVTTVRFNFRGVSDSEGDYSEGVGEQEDVLTVVAWVRDTFKPEQLWLGGFSFGGYVAYAIANQAKADQLLTLAPGITRFDVSVLPEPTMPWVVVQSDADEVIESAAVFDWLRVRQCDYLLLKLSGVSHFFHGELVRLRKQLEQLYAGRL